jgi:HEAT repeat protein
MQGVNANAIERLLDDLQNGDRGVVRRAVDGLVAMAPREPRLSDRLESRLQDEKTRWKWPVAYTLGRVVKASRDCLNVLAEGLGSEDQDVRWATQRLLTELGRTQSQVRELLLVLLHGGRPTQRRMAVYCLRDVGLSDDRFAEAVVKACQDPEPLVRVAAVTSLKTYPSIAAHTAPLLRRLADADADPRVRNAARFLLARGYEK